MKVMRKKMIAGDWKINLQPAEAAALVRDLADEVKEIDERGVILLICPPALYLPLALNEWQPHQLLAVGAQNCHYEKAGAYTGEISAEMCCAIGVKFCIVGHSERRALFGETDEMIKEKAAAVVATGMTAIVCCGETLEQRESGEHETVVARQLQMALEKISKPNMDKVIIAYEPVWAIGTGETATSGQAQQMHAFIRKELAQHFDDKIADNTSILYGGSCKPDNAAELFAQPDVDGGLIGGASLNADQFTAIARSF